MPAPEGHGAQRGRGVVGVGGEVLVRGTEESVRDQRVPAGLMTRRVYTTNDSAADSITTRGTCVSGHMFVGVCL